MSEDIDEKLEVLSESKIEPLEVKIVKEKEQKVEQDLDYIEYDITDEEIEEFGKQT